MTQLTERQRQTLVKFEKFIYEEASNPDFLVQIIELAGTYLNIRTISDYAKENNKSYNGVKNFAPIKEIFGIKFVIDNILNKD